LEHRHRGFRRSHWIDVLWEHSCSGCALRPSPADDAESMNANPLSWTFRRQYLTGAVICIVLLAYAYYEQFAMRVEPCPMCIFQRIAFIVLGIVFIVGGLHDPGRTGRRVYAILALVAAAIGAGIAIRHLWVQHLPPDPLASCAPGWNYMVQNFPIGKVLKLAFTGSADCAVVNWRFLGLTMPAWTLAWYIVLGIAALVAGFRARNTTTTAPA
jgi:disulfide bond formation protein DsbB